MTTMTKEDIKEIKKLQERMLTTEKNIVEINDKLNGRLIPEYDKIIRTFFSVNNREAVTSEAPFYVYFNLPSELAKIVYIKVICNIISGTPSLDLYVSENDGFQYSSLIGPFTANFSTDITGNITKSGDKLLKIESDANATLDIQVLIKIDIKAR